MNNEEFRKRLSQILLQPHKRDDIPKESNEQATSPTGSNTRQRSPTSQLPPPITINATDKIPPSLLSPPVSHIPPPLELVPPSQVAPSLISNPTAPLPPPITIQETLSSEDSPPSESECQMLDSNGGPKNKKSRAKIIKSGKKSTNERSESSDSPKSSMPNSSVSDNSALSVPVTGKQHSGVHYKPSLARERAQTIEMTRMQSATTDLLEGNRRSGSSEIIRKLVHPTPTALLIATHYGSQLRRSDSVIIRSNNPELKRAEPKSNSFTDLPLEPGSVKKTAHDNRWHSDDNTHSLNIQYPKKSLSPLKIPLPRRSVSSSHLTVTPSTTSPHDNNNNNVATTLVSSKSASAVVTIPKKMPSPRDTNIWAEKKDSEGNILFERDGDRVEVKAGTLNQLVMRLTNDVEAEQDFIQTFLICYRSFTTPEELFHKLMERFNIPSEENLPPNIVKTIQLRVISAIKRWMQLSFGDFVESPTLMEELKSFVAKIEVENASLAMQLNKALQLATTTHDDKEKQFSFLGPSKVAVLPDNVKSSTVFSENLLQQNTELYTQFVEELSAEDIAKHLTIIEFAMFKRIQAKELLNLAWSKPSLQHRAPNVLALIDRFNTVSAWVASTILWQPTLKKRVALVKKFLQIMKVLERLNNFSSLLALIAGLNNASVSRLKFTFGELTKKKIETLRRLESKMSSENSYKNYREALRTALPPVVPYIGVFLMDLTMIEEGNPDEIDGLINFQKLSMIYQVIEKVQRYQQDPYEFTPTESLLTFLLDPPHVADEKELYRLSVQREPRSSENKRRLVRSLSRADPNSTEPEQNSTSDHGIDTTDLSSFRDSAEEKEKDRKSVV